MEFWKCCMLLFIVGNISGQFTGQGCLGEIIQELDLNKSFKSSQTDKHLNCDTLFSTHFKDIDIKVAERIYNTAVRWDPAKGVFSAETFLSDIPKDKTNSTVLLLLQRVNSFALEFDSCQVQGQREYRIELQVGISGTKLSIGAAVNRNGLFAEASIAVVDVYSPKVGVQFTWNGWSDLALIVTGRIVAVNKRGYISGVGHVVKLVGDETKILITQYQDKLASYVKILTKAKALFQDKQQALRSANSVFDDSIAKLEDARIQFDVKKQDLQTNRKEFKNAQENLDIVCESQKCRMICIPGLKLATCYPCGYNCPCFATTYCMFQMKDPMCVFKDVWCWATNKRGSNFVSLEIAQGAFRVAEFALDGAKSSVGAAQVVVDNSRVLRDVAIAGLKTAEMGIDELQSMIEKAKTGLDGLKYLIDVGVNVASFIVEGVSENVIDVRNCGISVSAHSKDVFESGIELFCEVNFRGQRFKRVSRSLRLGGIYRLINNNNRGEFE